MLTLGLVFRVQRGGERACRIDKRVAEPVGDGGGDGCVSDAKWMWGVCGLIEIWIQIEKGNVIDIEVAIRDEMRIESD